MAQELNVENEDQFIAQASKECLGNKRARILSNNWKMEVLFDLPLRLFVAIAVYVALGPKHIEHLMFFGLFSIC